MWSTPTAAVTAYKFRAMCARVSSDATIDSAATHCSKSLESNDVKPRPQGCTLMVTLAVLVVCWTRFEHVFARLPGQAPRNPPS